MVISSTAICAIFLVKPDVAECVFVCATCFNSSKYLFMYTKRLGLALAYNRTERDRNIF